jgi:RNA polymerase sigma factor (sigma-70 family)
MGLRSGSILALVCPASNAQAPDAELVGRFRLDRDELAFAELVRRHGPMVFGTCRRLLSHWQDAEDAFQATFLVLACKPGAVRPPERLGAWLHGVACRVARKARRTDARRLEREARATPARPVESPDPVPDDLRAVIDSVLLGLPERYRAAVVLCDLEGLSRKDAAGRLGWSEGALSGRLARARKLLADRLTRRGVLLGAGGLGAVLSALAAPATVAGELTASTLAVARLVRGGLDALPAGPVAALAHGVTRSMLPTRFGLLGLFAGILAVGLVAAGSAAAFLPASAAEQPATAPALAPVARLVLQPTAAQAPKPAPTWRERVSFKHTATVTAVTFGPRDILYAGDADGGIVGWDVRKEQEWRVLLDAAKLQKKDPVDSLTLHPDAVWLYVVHGERPQLTAMNLEKFYGNGLGFGKGVKIFGSSADGRFVIHADPTDPKRVAFHSQQFPENKAPVPLDLEHKFDVTLAAAPDAELIVTVTTDGTVHSWNTEGKRFWTAEGKPAAALAVAPDGTMVAVSGKDGVRLLDGKTGKETHRPTGHDGAVHAIAFSGDGKTLATAGADKTVRVWNPATGKETAVLKGHTDAVRSVVVSADGTTIASGSADKTVKVWELKP